MGQFVKCYVCYLTSLPVQNVLLGLQVREFDLHPTTENKAGISRFYGWPFIRSKAHVEFHAFIPKPTGVEHLNVLAAKYDRLKIFRSNMAQWFHEYDVGLARPSAAADYRNVCRT